MSKTYISQALRQRAVTEAQGRCAYCHAWVGITGARPVIDHISPEAKGGETIWGNLCLICHSCNEFKGAQVEGVDPLTGGASPLFHPMQQRWGAHFTWSEDGCYLIGRTPTGRVTVEALQMNHPFIVEARRRWVSVGWHPPAEDLLL